MDFNNWKGRSFDEVVNDFADFLDAVKEIYFKNKDVETEMNKKQLDLLHDLELEDLKYHDMAKIAKEIRALRKSRREYKNEYLLAEPVKEFFREHSGDRFISDLRTLANSLNKTAHMLENQYYNRRSTIENISDIKKDSNKDEDTQAEDVIQLNRVLNKYCTYMKSSFDYDSDLGCKMIMLDLTVDFPINLKRGKDYIANLSSNISKFYRPRLKTVDCTYITSDMCLPDDMIRGRRSFTGTIIINSEDKPMYKLSIKIREGKEVSNSNNSSKKKGGKKKR